MKRNSNTNHFSVAIVGLGKIGMGYDLSLKSGKQVFSHAKAFDIGPSFGLFAGVDCDPNKRFTFSENYRAPTFDNITEMLEFGVPDIFVVSTDTQNHKNTIFKILELCKPSAILCEKPMGSSYDEALQIVQICQVKGVQLYVNYIRRGDPGVKKIKRMISSEAISLPFKAHVYYTNGLRNSASHFLDLLSYWFGDIKNKCVLSIENSTKQFDQNQTIYFEFEKGEAFFTPLWDNSYQYFSLEVMTLKNRIKYSQSGQIILQNLSKESQNLEYNLLDDVEIKILTEPQIYQQKIAEELSKALCHKENSLCTGEQALKISKWIDI